MIREVWTVFLSAFFENDKYTQSPEQIWTHSLQCAAGKTFYIKAHLLNGETVCFIAIVISSI